MSGDHGARIALGSSGVGVTRLVLGCAPIGGLYAARTEEEARGVLEAAWDGGVRAFDTAPHYGVGLSEERLGRFLATVPAAEVTVCTKVGRLLVDSDEDVEGVDGFYGTPRRRRVRDYTCAGVRRSIDESCARLGRDELDIVLIHDPEGDEHQALDEAYPTLVELRAEGVISAIGVGTKDRAVASWLVERAEFDCIMVAGQYSLLGTEAAEDLLPLCVERKVPVLLAGVYKSGVLADPRPGTHLDYAPASTEVLEHVGRLRAICEHHGVPLAAAALQFALAHPAVSAVAVGAATAEEMRDNLTYLSADIPEAVFAELAAVGPLRDDCRRSAS